MTTNLPRFLWVAAILPLGCKGTEPVQIPEKEVLPFEVRIDGKPAVFQPATADQYLIGRFPAAHIDEPVAVDAPIEIHLDPAAGVVRRFSARFVEVDGSGKPVSSEQNLNFPYGATEGKLDKLRGPAKYGMIVTVFMEGSAPGKNVRVRFETKPKA